MSVSREEFDQLQAKVVAMADDVARLKRISEIVTKALDDDRAASLRFQSILEALISASQRMESKQADLLRSFGIEPGQKNEITH